MNLMCRLRSIHSGICSMPKHRPRVPRGAPSSPAPTARRDFTANPGPQPVRQPASPLRGRTTSRPEPRNRGPGAETSWSRHQTQLPSPLNPPGRPKPLPNSSRKYPCQALLPLPAIGVPGTAGQTRAVRCKVLQTTHLVHVTLQLVQDHAVDRLTPLIGQQPPGVGVEGHHIVAAREQERKRSKQACNLSRSFSLQ